MERTTATLAEIRCPIEPGLKKLNQRLTDILVSNNELMDKVICTYLETKGKQIRPILVLLSARCWEEPTECTLHAAAAVELLHNASLIHDDVVDHSETRHGRPTVNSVWDNHIAVLIGDFFVSKALEEAMATADMRIIGALAKLGQLLSIGEMDQICNARFHLTTEDAYFQVIGRKTASLFEACTAMGAYSVGAADDDPQLAALIEYARLLGLCFQIRDDIFDYYDAGDTGKPTGNDLLEGKITLPLIYALDSDHPQAAVMRELSMKPELDADEVALLTDFAKQAGGIDYAYDRMAALRDQAASLVDDPSLLALFDYIIERRI